MKPMSGWISFAAIMMMIIGTLDFFEGLIAVVRGKYYVVSSSQIIVFDTRTWGWLTLIFGILLVLVGAALGGGAGWARWVTVFLASLNILAQLNQLSAVDTRHHHPEHHRHLRADCALGGLRRTSCGLRDLTSSLL